MKIRRLHIAMASLLAIWSGSAQQTSPKTDSTSKKDSTSHPATSGARELFYLAVAPKDQLPPISRTASAAPKGSAPSPATVNLGIRYNLLQVDESNRATPIDSDHYFRKGDCVALEIESNRSGYLYVLALQSSGAWYPLIPSSEMPDVTNIIDPGKRIRVPQDYCFEIKDPPGSERLVLVFSRDPQDFYELYMGIRNQKSTPPPSEPRKSSNPVQMADTSRVNDAVSRMQQQFGTRDITIRKVSQPLSSGEPAGSVYVVNTSNKPSSSVVTEIEIRHR